MDKSHDLDSRSAPAGVLPVGEKGWLADHSEPQSWIAQDQQRESIRSRFDWKRLHSEGSALDSSSDGEASTVYLICNDAGSCFEQSSAYGGAVSGAAGQFANDGMFFPDNRLAASNVSAQSGDSVVEVLKSGRNETVLPHSLLAELRLVSHLDGSSQTYDPPMLAKSTGFWNVASRGAEKTLVKNLLESRGEISLADLSRSALSACNGDSQLALLTLANFTKNMASIERRQVKPEQIAEDLRSTYSQSSIDLLFHRIQGMGVSKDRDYYNKEGALYHYFGAMLAGSQWGRVTEELVATDNSNLRNSDKGRTDFIKDQAGLSGARDGAELGKNYHGAGFLVRMGLRSAKYVSAEFTSF